MIMNVHFGRFWDHKKEKKIGMLGFYFEMSLALDFGPVHNFCSNLDILKVFRVITNIFEVFLNLIFKEI